VGKNGLYTTVDIIRIFPEIKMEKFQDWIKRGYIKPHTTVKNGTRIIKYFKREQLISIAIFKEMVDLGICRKDAQKHCLCVEGGDPAFVVIKVKNRCVDNVEVIEKKPGRLSYIAPNHPENNTPLATAHLYEDISYKEKLNVVIITCNTQLKSILAYGE